MSNYFIFDWKVCSLYQLTEQEFKLDFQWQNTNEQWVYSECSHSFIINWISATFRTNTAQILALLFEITEWRFGIFFDVEINQTN